MSQEWRASIVGALAITVFTSGASMAARPEPALPADPQAVNAPASSRQRDAVVARVDELIRAGWTAAGVVPATRAGDAPFLRRAFLDFTGVIPRVSDVRKFLAATHADKRSDLIEQLLKSPRYATHMATTWRNRLLPSGAEPAQRAALLGVQNWLRDHFSENTRFDSIVADLLVATDGDEYGPALYYLAHDLAPEKLAASTSELFLGVRLDCAQCHDHPYDDWTQQDFWGYAAFFARVRAADNNPMRQTYQLIDADIGEVSLPGNADTVPPQYLGGDRVDAQDGGTRRQQLALWMASRENGYMARAAVNWAWGHLLGRGLVEPVGDGGQHNPPSHPEVLTTLADYLVAVEFDLQELLRTIAATEAYHLASTHSGGERPAPRHFACMNAKVLTPEQLYDSLARIAPQIATTTPAANPRSVVLGNVVLDAQRIEFVAGMRTPALSSTEFSAGILQALMVMHGGLMSRVTSPDSSLVRALEAPYLSDDDRMETLYFAALARPPTPAERDVFARLLRQQENVDAGRRALGDMLWALLNSSEFAFNH